ncbi:MAG: DEAD/DEAH box helicase [Bacteroidaceae bacterium]|nr:DEAD/DEAH box helicase [Bacteroidaceae bacterium]
MADIYDLFRQDFVSCHENKVLQTTSGDVPPHFVLAFQQSERGEEAVLHVCDADGSPLLPSPIGQTGAELQVLTLMAQVAKRRSQNWGWSTDEATGYPLHEMPGVTLWLGQLSHLRDEQGRTLTQNLDEGVVELYVRRTEDGWQSKFRVRGARGNGLVHFLSDEGVLCGTTLYQVPSVGRNYRHLKSFEITLEDAHLDMFLNFFLSNTTNLLPVVEGYEVRMEKEYLIGVPTLIIERVEADQALVMRLTQQFGIGEQKVELDERFAYIPEKLESGVVFHPLRRTDMQVENERLLQVLQSCAPTKSARQQIWCEGDYYIVPQETASPFLMQKLPELLRNFRVLGAEHLRAYKLTATKPRLNVKIGCGIDFLEGSADIQLGEEIFTLEQFLKQYQKQNYILLGDGNRALIDPAYVQRLQRIFQKGKGREGVKISFFDLPEIELLLEERLEGASFERHRKVYEGFNSLKEQQIELPKVKATLRDYQREGVKWINYLYEQGLGGCLADDMGLGKTLQTISQLTLVYGRRGKKPQPALIVMPRSLLYNWQQELKRFAPHLKVNTYYGSDRNLEEGLKSHLILTTYAIVRNDIEMLMQHTFQYIILDESQNIKNVSSQATQAVFLLKGEHRLALSGTPLENNLTELYSLFRFLNPAMFGTLESFNEQYTNPIQRDGDSEAMQALRRKIFPFILRRLKRDVLTELPDRIEQTLYVDMQPDHVRYYEERRQYFSDLVHNSIDKEGVGGAQFAMFQAMSELRRIASIPESMTDGRITSPKLQPLADALIEAVSNSHKVVVFFNYIAGIELIGDVLEREGIGYLTMTGSTQNRGKVVESFQTDSSVQVLLMTLKTGGVGLNLTAADTVFIFEPWWNKAAEEQAINRLHRMGQTAKVLSYSILVRGTIEEKIRLLQEQKADLFDSIIESDSSMSKQLSEEDIRFILS